MNYGDVALGMLVSLIGWFIFIFIIFLPKLRRLRANVVHDIKAELPGIIEEAGPLLQKNLKIDWLQVLEDFSAGLKDEKKMEHIAPVMAEIAMILVVNAQAFVEQDEHFQKWLNGKVARWGEMVYKGAKNKAIKEAEDFGIDVQGIGESAEGIEVDDGIKKVIKMYQLYQQFRKGI